MDSYLTQKIEDHCLGEYHFTRLVLPQGLLIEGKASFTPLSEHTRLYQEQGHYTLGTKAYRSFQTRIFKFTSTHFYILRADGTTLHSFTRHGPHQHTHICQQDSYYIALKWFIGGFDMHYTISGPSKNYLIHTNFLAQQHDI